MKGDGREWWMRCRDGEDRERTDRHAGQPRSYTGRSAWMPACGSMLCVCVSRDVHHRPARHPPRESRLLASLPFSRASVKPSSRSVS